MPRFAPGSFTKNFGWNQQGIGLRGLYRAIRQGFSGSTGAVPRFRFRAACGVTDPDRQLIPVNFFLHNRILDGRNHVSRDELVRHACSTDYSDRFDLLALFAFHLGRQGHRTPKAGSAEGAAFATHYVKTRLWQNGGWMSSLLQREPILEEFQATIQTVGEHTAEKCATNYLYLLEAASLKGQRTACVNTRIDEWVGPALFLAFDRFALDQPDPQRPVRSSLLGMVRDDELHKLMGVTQAWLDDIAPLFADEYLALGGLDRMAGAGHAPIPAPASGMPPTAAASAPTGPGADAAPAWSDDAAEAMATLQRRLREIQAQLRNPRHVRELKALYDHACAFCGKRIVVGVGPDRHYSEAAHIKPVGAPHDGPDCKDNMLVLCPEHHIQFDRGMLTLQPAADGFRLRSVVPGDPLHGRSVRLQPPHVIAEEFVQYHADFWR
jgi:hypothetical protein